MHAVTSLLALSGMASVAVAFMDPAAMADGLIRARQDSDDDDGDDTQCYSSYISLISDLPTPPDSLKSAAFDLSEIPTETSNACAEATAGLPKSLSDDWTSYEGEVYSFYTEHSSDLSALATQCTELAGNAYVSQILKSVEKYDDAGCFDGVKDGSASPGGKGGIAATGAVLAGFIGVIFML